MSERDLEGVSVVITRPRERVPALAAALDARGAVPVPVPVIALVEPETWAPLDAALAEAARGAFTWVVFTSAAAVDFATPRVTSLGAARVAVVGPASAQAAARAGLEVALMPGERSSRGVAAALAATEGRGRVLLPRVQGASRALVEDLSAAGFEPVEVVAYRNVPAPTDTPEADRVRRGEFDAVTFASGSAARAFAAHVAAPVALGLDPGAAGPGVAVIGFPTAKAAAAAGFRVDAVAEDPSDEALAGAVAAWWGRRSGMGALGP